MNLYTAILLVELLMLLITSFDSLTNRLIRKDIKRKTVLASLFIALAASAEFVGVLTEGASPSLIPLHKAAKGIEYSIAPLTGVLAASAYANVKDSRTPLGIALAHALFECIAMGFDLVFSIDENNVSHHETFYFIYILAFSLSTFYIFFCVIRSGKEYQMNIDSVLILTLLLLALGVTIQFIYSEIKVDYLCVAIANYLLYSRYNKMVFQVDALTMLLNRGCYETNIESLRSKAILLFFDVNQFKKVNDTYGHDVGDLALKNIALRIKKTYGKYGKCYRIGGDEFCVIMNHHLEEADKLKESFFTSMKEMRKKDPRMPSVSLGYATYDSSLPIEQVIKEADADMYQNKKAREEEAE